MNLGIPDCIVALYGKFHLVELKVALPSGKVKLSPHQIAFHAAHQDCPTWIFVQHDKGRKARLLVYAGKQAKQVMDHGIQVPPILECVYPWCWEEVEDRLTMSTR